MQCGLRELQSKLKRGTPNFGPEGENDNKIKSQGQSLSLGLRCKGPVHSYPCKLTYVRNNFFHFNSQATRPINSRTAKKALVS